VEVLVHPPAKRYFDGNEKKPNPERPENSGGCSGVETGAAAGGTVGRGLQTEAEAAADAYILGVLQGLGIQSHADAPPHRRFS